MKLQQKPLKLSSSPPPSPEQTMRNPLGMIFIWCFFRKELTNCIEVNTSVPILQVKKQVALALCHILKPQMYFFLLVEIFPVLEMFLGEGVVQAGIQLASTPFLHLVPLVFLLHSQLVPRDWNNRQNPLPAPQIRDLGLRSGWGTRSSCSST